MSLAPALAVPPPTRDLAQGLRNIAEYGLTIVPIRFSGSHAQFDQPAMELGVSNDEIYRKLLNLSDDELSGLRTSRII